MSANIIDGKEVARKLREKISRSVKEINSEHNIVPGLAVVLVGNDPASEVYVRNKGIQTKETGMISYEYKLPEGTSEDDLLDKAITAIIDASKTGKIGDGKIFVSNIDKVIRIRI